METLTPVLQHAEAGMTKRNYYKEKCKHVMVRESMLVPRSVN